jgi:hypothetical protein
LIWTRFVEPRGITRFARSAEPGRIKRRSPGPPKGKPGNGVNVGGYFSLNAMDSVSVKNALCGGKKNITGKGVAGIIEKGPR